VIAAILDDVLERQAVPPSRSTEPFPKAHQGGLIAKLQNDQQTVEVRSPIAGRIRTLFAESGGSVNAGAEIATVDPAVDQVWESLRALYLVGQPDDLPAIARYQRELPEVPDHIRQQALLTDKAIRDRAGAGH
jgi:pyruvate/2-oxoglutarate dehydrogenase complex dihydrolipoamide acyltransferase (E2) component